MERGLPFYSFYFLTKPQLKVLALLKVGSCNDMSSKVVDNMELHLSIIRT